MRPSMLPLLLLIVAGMLFPPLASACHVMNQSQLSIVLEGSLQKDPLQANVGDTLYTKRASLSTLAHQRQDISCAPSQPQEQLTITGNMTGSMTGNNVFPTSVPGIGIRISLLVRQHGSHSPLSALPVSEQFALDEKSDLTSDDVFIKTELVKTGPIANVGHVSYQTSSMVVFTRSSAQQVVSVDYSFSATVPAGYCHFTTPSAAFNLIPVDAVMLKAQRTTSAISLDVNYVCTGAPSHVEMTVYGVAEDAGQGIFKNTLTAENATGVGIQMLYRNTPVALGTPISLDSLQTVNNQTAIPLSARYIAISPNVTAGKITSLATIKLNFL
jgi:minor fimbrial subunit